MGEELEQVQQPDKPSNKVGKIFSIILDVIIVLLVILLIGRFIFNANFVGVYVVGNSMSPTLTGARNEKVEGGDYLYADKNAKPDYGNIVIIDTLENLKRLADKGVIDESVVSSSERIIIKRVVAMEGDSVFLENGKLKVKYKNSTEFVYVDEEYVNAEYNDSTFIYNTTSVYDVPEGEVFVLGDNRNISKDSRYYGTVPVSSVVGVITDWSLDSRPFNTAVYSFQHFTLPNLFGNKN